MKQPPAKRQIPPVGLEVIAKGVRKIVIVVVFKTDRIFVCRRSQRDHAGQIAPTTKKVELNASKDGQKRQRVDQSERPSNSCCCQYTVLFFLLETRPTHTRNLHLIPKLRFIPLYLWLLLLLLLFTLLLWLWLLFR